MIKKINLVGSAIILVSYFGILPEPNVHLSSAALFCIGIAINAYGLTEQKHSRLAIFYVVFMAAIFLPGILLAIQILPAVAAFLPLLLSLVDPVECKPLQKEGAPF